jgi:hypothetical protein
MVGVGLRPLVCWDYRFESHRWNGCLSLVSVVCCEVDVSLRRADHSSRGVLQSVVCLSVIAQTRQLGGLGPLGLSSHSMRIVYDLIIGLHRRVILIWVLKKLYVN